MSLSRFQQCRAFSRAVMDEKSSPLFPVGGGVGGAVVTNDCCITTCTAHEVRLTQPAMVAGSFYANL